MEKCVEWEGLAPVGHGPAADARDATSRWGSRVKGEVRAVAVDGLYLLGSGTDRGYEEDGCVFVSSDRVAGQTARTAGEYRL